MPIKTTVYHQCVFCVCDCSNCRGLTFNHEKIFYCIFSVIFHISSVKHFDLISVHNLCRESAGTTDKNFKTMITAVNLAHTLSKKSLILSRAKVNLELITGTLGVRQEFIVCWMTASGVSVFFNPNYIKVAWGQMLNSLNRCLNHDDMMRMTKMLLYVVSKHCFWFLKVLQKAIVVYM